MHQRVRDFLAYFFLVLGFNTVLGFDDSIAGVIELGGGFSYSHTTYGDSSYSWTRRFSLRVGYHFWTESEIAFDVQDVFNRAQIADVQDTIFHDQIYSVQWIQSFVPRDFFVQPFVKFGVGQLNRQASGSYSGGSAPPASYETITPVLGAGIKFRVVDAFSIRFEGSTYLMNGSIATASDNFSFNSGVTIYF